MRRLTLHRRALALALALLVLAPAVSAGPLILAAASRISYSWQAAGQSASCVDNLALTWQEAPLRLLLSAQSGTRGAPYPDARCAMVVTVAPGAYVNPCDLLTGNSPSPAQGVNDPFLHRGAWNTYSKTVRFANGGVANYHVDTEPSNSNVYHWGSCTAPGASATWTATAAPWKA